MANSINKIEFRTFCGILILLVCGEILLGQPSKTRRAGGVKTIQLPSPALTGSVAVEEAITKQQKITAFADKSLSYEQIGQLAWAGWTIADKDMNNRGINPLEIYFLTAEGLFNYQPGPHSLEQISSTDLRKELSTTVNKEAIAQAGCDIIITGTLKKEAPKPGPGAKATKLLPLEAGRVAGNIQLQAAALGLETTLVDEFETREVARVCRLSSENEPLLIVGVGFSTEQKIKEGSASKRTRVARKALLIVPSINFRDEEFFGTQRILKEAGIAVVTASFKTGTLMGMSGGITASEITLDKVNVEDFNAVIFIAGTGATEYFNNQLILEITRRAAAGRKVIAAISTTPAILADAGVLKGVRATGHLSVREQMLMGGATYTGTTLERDGMIITSSDFSAVTPFARAIVAALKGTE
jgi:protease I